MRGRGFKTFALLLSLLILANRSVEAGPVVFTDVTQRIRGYQNPPELLLRNLSPDSRVDSLYDTKHTTSVSADAESQKAGSVLGGITVDISDQKPVTVVAQGDVEATVCDCGEITVPGGFPKWPLLFLAAIPLFFIPDDDCEDCDRIIPNPLPSPNPTPTPTPQTPVPEPASILLFGSGLAAVGAALRRRRKMKTISGDHAEEG